MPGTAGCAASARSVSISSSRFAIEDGRGYNFYSSGGLRANLKSTEHLRL